MYVIVSDGIIRDGIAGIRDFIPLKLLAILIHTSYEIPKGFHLVIVPFYEIPILFLFLPYYSTSQNCQIWCHFVGKLKDLLQK